MLLQQQWATGALKYKNNTDSPESLNTILLTPSSFQPRFYFMLVPAFLTTCFFTDSLDLSDTLHSTVFFAIRSAISFTDICRYSFRYLLCTTQPDNPCPVKDINSD